jgi:nucleotide-binding universal stress UspA family protein
MTLVHRILVPTDFSVCAEHAFEYAAELAVKLAAPLVLLHVYPLPVAYGPEGIVWQMAPSVSDIEAELVTALTKLAVRARELGVRDVETVTASGGAWREILRVAEDRACDLIVMGTHGRGGFEHLLLGSVAEKVVRKARCPVLTVTQRAKPSI